LKGKEMKMNLNRIVVWTAFTMLTGMFLTGCGSNSDRATTSQMGGAKQGNNLTLIGAVSTLAGQGLPGITDGVGSTARFNTPSGITTDGSSLYIADTGNNTIRKVDIATGAVTTLAGTVGTSAIETTGSTDGIGTAAKFNSPSAITTDGINLYVADTNNHTIRKIVIATGAVTTLAGSAGTFGSADGIGSAALFYAPSGITTDGTNLYVSDTANLTIRKIVIATGAVTTLAGSTGVPGSADGLGSSALFGGTFGITTDGTNLFVADAYNNTIRKIVISTGMVTTLAGSAGPSGNSDGFGSASRFNFPCGITTDGTNLFVADSRSDSIRKIVIATGAVTTLITGTSLNYTSPLNFPLSITTDGASLFVADTHINTIERVK
jgi:sugar lactone lactonase YvrE